MDQGLIPRRYAKALLEVADKAGQAASLYQSMQKLDAAFAAEPKLGATTGNPFVSVADKSVLVKSAIGADKADPQIDNMLRVLAENNRMDMVRDIAIAYMQLYRKANDIYLVHVESAASMQPSEEERLKKIILAHLRGGHMEYSASVNPDLIGGFVVSIDNERLDASVKNELKQLRLKLLSNKQ